MFPSETERLARPQLEALQLERLRRQVQRCWRHSPFLRRKLAAAGVQPSQIRSLADLRRLPFTTREELREEQLRRPPAGDLPLTPRERWLEIHPTTGGSPAYVAWSRGDLAAIRSYTARLLHACGVRPGDLVQNTLAYGLWPGGLAIHYGMQQLGACVLPAGMDALKRQIELLVNFRPRVLVSLPSAALYLAEQLRERGLSPADTGLEIGLFAGEPGVSHPATRARLEQALGVKAYDLYGIVEVGPIMAGECQAQAGLHWPEDHFLVEIIDPETLAPCPPDTYGILVLTSLTGETMPALRYWTNDYACITAAPCPCGRTLARSPGGIRGRSDQMIIVGGAKFYPAQIEQILHRFRELGDEFRILLEREADSWLDRCTLVVEHAPQVSSWELDGLARQLAGVLADELRLQAGVRVVRYGTLGRTVTPGGRVQDLRPAGEPVARSAPGPRTIPW